MRQEWGRLVALLLSQFRRLDLVEDALGDAVEAASRTWPVDGTPDNPAGWLMTAARRRVLDRLRTEGVAQRKLPMLLTDAEHRQEGARTMADSGSHVEDDVLRLVLMCAHPALAPEAAGALSLRLVLGVPTADIARLFLVPEPTMAARITRAKKRIVGAGIPFAVPDAAVLPDRLDIVAQTAYLAFTAGYAPGTGPTCCVPTCPARRSVWSASCSACDPGSRHSSRCWPWCCCSTRAATPASATGVWSCSPTRTAVAGTTTRSPRRCGCWGHRCSPARSPR